MTVLNAGNMKRDRPVNEVRQTERQRGREGKVEKLLMWQAK